MSEVHSAIEKACSVLALQALACGPPKHLNHHNIRPSTSFFYVTAITVSRFPA